MREPKPDAATYLVSYPKAGRTWLRALVGKALVDHYGLPPAKMLETEALTAMAGLPIAAFYHDGAAMIDGLAWHELQADKSAYRNRRVLLIGRDARDTLVSAYFQATRRVRAFDGPIADFVRDDRFGARKVATFYRQWEDARDVPASFAFLRYESMHDAPAAELRRALDFLGATEVTDATVDAAVEFARFDNLRRAEASNQFRSAMLRSAAGDDPEAFKVRRGKVGGFRDYLDRDDIAWIDACVTESRCTFLAPAQ